MTQGYGDFNLFQVMLRRSFKQKFMPVSCAVLGGNGYFQFTGQVLASKRFFRSHYVFQPPCGHYLSSMYAGPGANIHNIIRCFDRIFIMFHDNHRISQIPQPLQCSQQAIVVTRMQSDTWFIQHIENPYQAGPHLGGQADTLGFTPGKTPCCSIQGQVLQPHIHQESQPFPDFFYHLPSNEQIPLVQLQLAEKIQGIPYGKSGKLVDVLFPQQYP
ncbi:MAG: hypothetical protein BWY80_01275 [Firmicutes bacterium ADurb.Bin456]|nr:MAG: hypothetical protein BWY80_01275 [Firmicutes bacterium ADurb.Bin456]